MGNIGYGYDEDEEDDQIGEEKIAESKQNHSKKKKSAKKMKETTENIKFKQTRLIFTPKDDALAGQKRLHSDSPK